MLSAEERGFTLSTKNIGNKNIFKEDIDYLSMVTSKYKRDSFSGKHIVDREIAERQKKRILKQIIVSTILSMTHFILCIFRLF